MPDFAGVALDVASHCIRDITPQADLREINHSPAALQNNDNIQGRQREVQQRDQLMGTFHIRGEDVDEVDEETGEVYK
jgi:hypothetical protein